MTYLKTMRKSRPMTQGPIDAMERRPYRCSILISIAVQVAQLYHYLSCFGSIGSQHLCLHICFRRPSLGLMRVAYYSTSFHVHTNVLTDSHILISMVSGIWCPGWVLLFSPRCLVDHHFFNFAYPAGLYRDTLRRIVVHNEEYTSLRGRRTVT